MTTTMMMLAQLQLDMHAESILCLSKASLTTASTPSIERAKNVLEYKMMTCRHKRCLAAGMVQVVSPVMAATMWVAHEDEPNSFR